MSKKRSKIGDFAAMRSVWSKISGRRDRPPPITFAQISQSVSVPCQNSGVGGSHGFLLTSFSHHLNEIQRSKPSRALQPPKQGTSLPSPSSLTLDSSLPFY